MNDLPPKYSVCSSLPSSTPFICLRFFASMTMETTLLLASLSLFLFIKTAHSQCVFNDTTCSCAFGTTSGACYERTGNDGFGNHLCRKRTCNAGWTCDCDGDFFCNQDTLDVYTLTDFDDFDATTNVPCQLTSQTTITSSGFELGFFHPQFSDNGLLNGQCQDFTWWLDGIVQNEFTEPVAVTAANLDQVKASMSDWNSLPLLSGTVIGFRWAGAPYSCYNSISLLSINGTETDTSNAAVVTHRFSNIFENDWFSPDFVEAENWQESIASNTNDNYGIENTEITNTYWRIKIL